MSLFCYRSLEQSRIVPGSSTDGSAAHRPFYLFVNNNNKCEALNRKLYSLSVCYIVSYFGEETMRDEFVMACKSFCLGPF